MSKENDSNNKNARNRSHNEDDCQDKACSEAQNNFKSWMKNRNKHKGPECPLDRNSLGRNTWSLLHTIAAKYPLRPGEQDKVIMKEFITLISILYPCSDCAKEFREDIRDMPPKLDSRDSLTLWFCQVHNKVNAKLNKPQFDCRRVDERWRTGWKDGSCM